MVKISSNSATSTPFWLLSATMVLLVLRMGLSAYENFYPPKGTEYINWVKAENLDKNVSAAPKLYFYNFRAKWCEPCNAMDKTGFVSKDVVKLLSENFVPIEVTDRKREDGKNTAQVQLLEDKFNIQAFPSLVVALEDGTKIIDHLGSTTTPALKRFLAESLTLASYFRGKEALFHGDARAAADSFERFIANTKWQHWRCAYAAIFASAAHRELGENEKADKIVQESLVKVHDHTFPYPILEYFAGKRNFDQLLSSASENKTNRILSYAYAGLDQYSRKEFAEAKKKLDWVLANCDDKESFEFRISRSNRERIDTLPSALKSSASDLEPERKSASKPEASQTNASR